MCKNKDYKTIEDIDKFVSYVSIKYGIKKREGKEIIEHLNQAKSNGELLYEENYNNEDQVRVFNKHNIRLWEYIQNNSVDSFDGTASTELRMKDLLDIFNYPDTKEFRGSLVEDINDFVWIRNIIISSSGLRIKAWIESLVSVKDDKFIVTLPYSKERQIRYFKNNPVIGG